MCVWTIRRLPPCNVVCCCYRRDTVDERVWTATCNWSYDADTAAATTQATQVFSYSSVSSLTSRHVLSLFISNELSHSVCRCCQNRQNATSVPGKPSVAARTYLPRCDGHALQTADCSTLSTCRLWNSAVSVCCLGRWIHQLVWTGTNNDWAHFSPHVSVLVTVTVILNNSSIRT